MPNSREHFQLKALPESLRPRERLERYGPEVLTTVELLAIVLGSGAQGIDVMEVATNLLQKFHNLENLQGATIAELVNVKGIGRTKAIQIKAILSLGFRLNATSKKRRLIVETPADVYSLFKEKIAFERREHFGVVLLDVRSRVIRCEIVSIGSLTETLVHPREVFQPAIRHQAASMILVHNHPSGDLTPSSEDLNLTRSLLTVGEVMRLPIVDHIIISSEGYLSIRDTTNLFT